MRRSSRLLRAIVLTMLWPTVAQGEAPEAPSPDAVRAPAAGRAPGAEGTLALQLLGLNDFHGNLTSTRHERARPVGGAAVLAAYLRDEAARFPGTTLIVHAGDMVGASPPASALLADEPSIQFLNLLANPFCTPTTRAHPRCNVVGTLGNHEFDEGVRELLRLVRGGRAEGGPFLERPYRGAHFAYVSANVVDARSGRPILPPFVIKQVDGVRVGIIGAVIASTPSMVVAGGVRSVRFLDEAAAINRAARTLVRQGVEAIVVTIHQGGRQAPYEGPTRRDAPRPEGDITALVAALDDAIDVVISGHAHAFTNALLENAHGHEVLVTQARSAGVAYAAIALTLDRARGDVVQKSARIVSTFGDAGPGITPAPDVAALVAEAERTVLPLTERLLGHAPEPISDVPNQAGESPIGDLIADAQRAAMGAQIALMNTGGIRTGLPAGAVSWGRLFAVQPFGNQLVAMNLTGAQVRAALEAQWQRDEAHLLQVSGLAYAWDPKRPPGSRVVDVRVGDAPLAPDAVYRVVVNSFLADGGSGFRVFREGKARQTGPLDRDALSSFVAQHGAPLAAPAAGRIERR